MTEKTLMTPRSVTKGDQDAVNYFDEINRKIDALETLTAAQKAQIAALEARVAALEAL